MMFSCVNVTIILMFSNCDVDFAGEGLHLSFLSLQNKLLIYMATRLLLCLSSDLTISLQWILLGCVSGRACPQKIFGISKFFAIFIRRY